MVPVSWLPLCSVALLALASGTAVVHARAPGPTEAGEKLLAAGKLGDALNSFLHAVEHEHSVPAARRHFNMARTLMDPNMGEFYQAYVSLGTADQESKLVEERKRTKAQQKLHEQIGEHIFLLQQRFVKAKLPIPDTVEFAMQADEQSKKLDKMEESLVKYVSNVYGSQGVSETEKEGAKKWSGLRKLVKSYRGRELKLLRLIAERYKHKDAVQVQPEQEAAQLKAYESMQGKLKMDRQMMAASTKAHKQGGERYSARVVGEGVQRMLEMDKERKQKKAYKDALAEHQHQEELLKLAKAAQRELARKEAKEL